LELSTLARAHRYGRKIRSISGGWWVAARRGSNFAGSLTAQSRVFTSHATCRVNAKNATIGTAVCSVKVYCVMKHMYDVHGLFRFCFAPLFNRLVVGRDIILQGFGFAIEMQEQPDGILLPLVFLIFCGCGTCNCTTKFVRRRFSRELRMVLYFGG